MWKRQVSSVWNLCESAQWYSRNRFQLTYWYYSQTDAWHTVHCIQYCTVPYCTYSVTNPFVNEYQVQNSLWQKMISWTKLWNFENVISDVTTKSEFYELPDSRVCSSFHDVTIIWNDNRPAHMVLRLSAQPLVAAANVISDWLRLLYCRRSLVVSRCSESECWKLL